MNIAICDDEKTMTELLQDFIGRWAQFRGCACAVQSFTSGEELLFETTGSYPFDLILLDIELGSGNLTGLELARKIRETDSHVDIAFLTNHSGYVFEGYEVSALRYLLKPVTEDNLFPLLDLTRERMERVSRYLVLETDGERRRVEEDDILCLEAQNHTVLVESTSGTLEVKTALSALAQQLGSDFVPTHRSFIVNLRHVERVGANRLPSGQWTQCPCQPGAWGKLNQAFISCYREE